MSSKSKCWRRTLGERGLRVYLFERSLGGTLYREVYVGGKRVAAKKSLGHRDKERALADGYTLLARLKVRDDALREGKFSLSTLFDIYGESAAHRAKKPLIRVEDERKLKRLVEFLGPDRDVRSLSDNAMEEYSQARMRGLCGSRPVGARSVAADLVALNTALNWATRQRNGRGVPLVERNPLRGVKLPVEKNPRRPVETYERYLKLLAVAAEVDWRLPAVLILVESTGQRIGSILGLQREDLDFSRAPFGWLRFRAERQKTGYEHWVPLTEQCRRELDEHLVRLSGDQVAWLFPATRNPSRPVDRSVMSRSLREAYRRAGLSPPNGGLWHPWRRKWATERKGLPLKDVAAAGGWRDVRTLLTSYQQPDEATLIEVVLRAPKLYANGVGESPELPHSLPQPSRKGKSSATESAISSTD